MFKSFKNFLRNYFFRKDLLTCKRKVRMVTLEEATNIGVIFTMYSEEDFKVMGRFIKKLQEQGKKVKSIAFNGEKIIPPYYMQTLTQDVILMNHLSWLSFPKAPFVTEFIESPFDILFDFSLKPVFPLFYLATMSNAGFKIGMNHDNNIPFFDLMIGASDNTSVETQIESTLSYLEQIKPINS